MEFSKSAVNTTTNALGVIAGVPEILQAIPLIAAGDYVGGGVLLARGLALLVGFYFVGKGV
jgi:hypothetical protein